MQDFSKHFKGKKLRRVTRAAARNAAHVRALNTSYRFWEICCLAPCRRARACTSDAQMCFRDHAGMFSAEQLRWIDNMLVARRRGLDWDKAAAQATRLMADRQSVLSQISPGHAAPKNRAPAPSAQCRSG